MQTEEQTWACSELHRASCVRCHMRRDEDKHTFAHTKTSNTCLVLEKSANPFAETLPVAFQQLCKLLRPSESVHGIRLTLSTTACARECSSTNLQQTNTTGEIKYSKRNALACQTRRCCDQLGFLHLRDSIAQPGLLLVAHTNTDYT
jgi:hypothetical protein